MIIKVLISYEDPMDNCLPPQTYIYEWVERNITPLEWYKVLANPHGNCYFKV